MEIWHQLGLGFNVALDPINILLCFVGVLFGTLVGVLPGLGPAASISLLLPTTFHLSPWGESSCWREFFMAPSTADRLRRSLFNIPGEVTSVVTCLDGYQMARNGRAGRPSAWRPSGPSLPELWAYLD